MSRTVVLRRVYAVAAVALLALACIYFSSEKELPARPAASVAKESSEPVAFRVSGTEGVVVHRDGARWPDVASGDVARADVPLRVGPGSHTELQAGATQLTVGPSAELVPAAGRSARLLSGNLTVAMPDANAAPFAIETEFGRVKLCSGEVQLHADAARVLIRARHGDVRIALSSETTLLAPEDKIVALTPSGVREADADSIPVTFTLPENAPPKPENIPVHGSPGIGRLVLKDTLGREAAPLEIQELKVKTTVLGSAGAVALTEIEETFFNPTAQRAEGTFYITLPPGASLARLAMWIDGKLVEGELVERARARHVYEEIVHRMQDPALMEWQEGNVFKTRIFPIPPHSPKRILIAYTQALAAQNGEYTYVYNLGSTADRKFSIGHFQFEAALSGVDVASEAAVSCKNYPDAQITPGANASVKLQRSGFRPTGDLALRFHSKAAEPLTLAADRRQGENGFFLLSYRAPNDTGTVPAKPSGPRDVVLLVDTSLSRHADDYHAQLRAARVLLEQLRPTDRFAVMSFDVITRTPEAFTVATPGNVRTAIAQLDTIMPLGATDMERAFTQLGSFLKHNPPRGTPDVILLGDGIATYGKVETAELLPAARALLTEQHARFSAMVLGSLQNRLLCTELTRASGGLFRTVAPGDDVESEAFRLALALETPLLPAPKLSFTGVEVYDVYPPAPGSLLPGQELLVTGRYKAAGALTVRVEQGSAAPVSATFTLPETESSNVFVPRVWAREYLDALLASEQSPDTVQQVIKLSQEFTLISPYTSFLVLENEQQYTQYGIQRQLRRRYWEEQGQMRSAPPEPAQTPAAVPVQPQPSAPPAAAPSPGNNDVVQKSQRTPSSLFETLDLSNLSQKFDEGRVLSTALSGLCLETYYRYRQIQAERPNETVMVTELSHRAEMGDHFETLDASDIKSDSPRGPIQTRDITAQPDTIPPPPRTDARPADLAASATRGELDAQLAQSAEEFLDRIQETGEGSGEDFGQGHGSFGMRSGGGRRLLVRRHGGSAATESATERAQDWLAHQQHEDGHWGAHGLEETSFALLCYLGAGHTEKVGSNKQVVQRGVAWLKSMQSPDGQIGSNTYEHALATLALSEAAGMGRVPATCAIAQRAVNYLARVQCDAPGRAGGWTYHYGAASLETPHPVVTAFAAMALKSAKVAGLHVDAATFERVLEYLDRNQAADGRVGASGKPEAHEVNLLSTAALACARLMLGETKDDARITGAADCMSKFVAHKPLGRDGLFTRYFATLVLFQLGGERWKEWNDWSKQELMNAAVQGENNGTWWPAEGIWLFDRVPPDLQHAPERIRTTLEAVRWHRGDRRAYEAFATALSQSTDMDLLREICAEAERSDARSGALVRARMGMLLLERDHPADAVAEFKAAYDNSDHAEHMLELYVGALQRSTPRVAVELLADELSQGLTSPLRVELLATLLFDREAGIEKPAEFLAARQGGDAARWAQVKALCAENALKKQRNSDAADLYLAAYTESGRDEDLVHGLVNALTAAKQQPELLALLLKEGNEGRWTQFRGQTCANLLVETPAGTLDIPETLTRELNARTDIRLNLCATAATLAAQQSRPPLAAALFALAYRDSNGLERYAKEWVAQLRAGGHLADARDTLIREAREQKKLSGWRMEALAEILNAEQGAPTAEELFPNKPRAQWALKLAQAELALRQNAMPLASRLFGDVYHANGRPESLIEKYVRSLVGAQDLAGAARELEYVIPGGYQNSFALDTLRDAYEHLGRSPDDILRAATSEIELLPRDLEPRMKLAHWFEAQGRYPEALQQYREAVRIRPEDAPLYRKLIEDAAGAGRIDFARELLVSMLKHWPNQGNAWGVHDEALYALLQAHPEMKAGDKGVELDALIKDLKHCDLVVVLTWDTDKTDIDLHVTEPTNEESSYQHKANWDGGFLDQDVTTGFGPETYTLRHAVASGTYKVELHYYSGSVPTNATVKVYLFKNTERETVQMFKAKLEKMNDRVLVTNITVPAAKK